MLAMTIDRVDFLAIAQSPEEIDAPRANYSPKVFDTAVKLIQGAENKQKQTKKSKQLGSPSIR